MTPPPNIPGPNDAEVPHPPDKIGGPLSTSLAGYTFQYTYSSGVHYRISFTPTTVYFTLPEPVHGRWILALPYRCREIRPELYMIHWLVPGRTGHVALLFDLENNIVDGAGLMPGRFELFDRANLGIVLRGGVGSLKGEDPTKELRELRTMEELAKEAK